MIGRILDNKYRIISELGQGGMGTVYLAEHTAGIGKKFAIKSLSPTLGHDPDFRERFYRQATLQALLDHPNIVRTDFFEKDGQFFLVMEYVDGRDLSKLIETRGQLKEKDALSILKDVLRGLEFAHAKGIIHGDIKPSNILIDKSGIARITDFAIAPLVARGGLVSTPAYLSPEQIMHPGQLDLRTDIYNLGLVLYEMLAGHLPFPGESDFSRMEQQLYSPPPNLHLKNPAISEKLAEIVSKALAKNPAERFQDCTEFLQCVQEQEEQQSEETKLKAEAESQKRNGEGSNRGGKFFFSYARADSEFVLKLAEDLRSVGTNLWLDQLDIPGGARWDRAVEEALHASPCLLVVLSPASVASNNVMDEVSFGLETNKRIVPILFKDCAIPFRLKRLHYIDFRVGYNDGFTRLMQTIKTVDQLPTPPEGETDLLERLRKQMLVAHTSWELRQLLYEVEAYLAKYPHSPEARLLKDHMQAAMRHAEDMENLPKTPRKLSLLRWLFGLVTLGIIVYALLRFFGAL
jgi:serine/threonine protein kinase